VDTRQTDYKGEKDVYMLRWLRQVATRYRFGIGDLLGDSNDKLSADEAGS
jgi:hypothetical protein